LNAVNACPNVRLWLAVTRRLPTLSSDAGRADRLQEPRADLSPADQEHGSHGVERRLPELACGERIGHVQRESHHAGEDQQSTSWTKHVRSRSNERQVPGTQQQPEDREINRRGNERSDPDRHTEPKGEVEDVAKAKEERQPDDRSHDHGDRPDDDRRVYRRSSNPAGLDRCHQASPPVGSTGKVPSITSRPVRIPWSGRHPSAWCPAGGSNPPSRYNPHDAIYAAVFYLCDSGAQKDIRKALFAYNHSEEYVNSVLAQAKRYRTAIVGTGDCNKIQAPNPAAIMAINFACGQLGLPYVWGGNGPAGGHAGFDCSGLTKAAYNAAGINLPRTAQTQYNAGPLVPAGQPLLPGDLVYYGTPGNVHHVGLYIGAGKMVHAPTFGQPVQVSNYRWNEDDYLAASRPTGDARV
jgi:cell wall-associated NlpC family hydrolase